MQMEYYLTEKKEVRLYKTENNKDTILFQGVEEDRNKEARALRWRNIDFEKKLNSADQILIGTAGEGHRIDLRQKRPKGKYQCSNRCVKSCQKKAAG